MNPHNSPIIFLSRARFRSCSQGFVSVSFLFSNLFFFGYLFIFLIYLCLSLDVSESGSIASYGVAFFFFSFRVILVFMVRCLYKNLGFGSESDSGQSKSETRRKWRVYRRFVFLEFRTRFLCYEIGVC